MRPPIWPVLLFTASLASCGSRSEAAPAVIVIVVDTLRRDALGCYGHPDDPSPRIDALAEEGVRFDHALSTSGWTLPSVASLLTGTWPSVHRALGKKTRLTPISGDVPTAAEVFAEAGFATRAVANAAFLSPMLDLDRGFEVFDHEAAFNDRIRRADESVDTALSMVDECAGQPLFLVLHVFDPHLDFDAPPGFADRFVDGRAEPPTPISIREVQAMLRAGGRRPPSDEDVAYLKGQYQGEVAFVDESLIILTVVRGDEFWEHMGFEHGHSLHDELVRVPLIVKPPKGEAVAQPVVDAQVRVLDSVPTAFELTGIDTPPSFVGHSLSPLWRGTDGTDRPVWLEGTLYGQDWTGIRTNRYTYLAQLMADGRKAEHVYDWRTDPGETRNLAASDPDLLTELRARYATTLSEVQALAAGTRAGEAKDINPETSAAFEKSLETLGYTGRDEDQ